MFKKLVWSLSFCFIVLSFTGCEYFSKHSCRPASKVARAKAEFTYNAESVKVESCVSAGRWSHVKVVVKKNKKEKKLYYMCETYSSGSTSCNEEPSNLEF